MNARRRFLAFIGVGLIGIGVQLVVVHACLHRLHVHYAVATSLGVIAAVVHNFVWHRHWTWADRRSVREHALAVFARFALANGAVSLAGNLIVVTIVMSSTRFDGVLANAIAIAVCGLANFWAGDRWVFVPGRIPTPQS